MICTPLGGDELVDPGEVAGGRLGAVLCEGAEVAVAAARGCSPGLGEALVESRPAPLEQREAGVAGEVPAERELEGEGLLLVGAGRILALQELGEELLTRIPNPTDEQIRWAISGNICRCTGYMNIVKAIQHAAKLTADAKAPVAEGAMAGGAE